MSTTITNPTKIDPTKLYSIRPDGVWEFYLDHHRMSGLKCEQYFEYKHIQNQSPRGELSWPIQVGLWWARVMELYYDSMREHKLDRGLSIELALLAWQECNMDASEKTFPSSFEKFGGKSGAYNLIANYFDQTYQFESQHWTIVASEAGFGLNREVLITGASDVMVYWLGRPDLIIIENDRLVPLDHKTVDRIESRQAAKYKPHPQTAGYIIAAQSIADSLGIKTEVDRCLINAVARSEPTEHPKDGKPRSRFMKIPISYSQDELTEWAEQILGKARRLRYSIEHNEWLRNETQCHIYSGCSFRPVCSVPRGSRELILKSNYTKIEAWAPYRPAED